MKFKVYPWIEIDRRNDDDEKSLDWTIELLPLVQINYRFHDFKPSNDFPGLSKGAWFTILFSWLIFGITFDFRFGDEE